MKNLIFVLAVCSFVCACKKSDAAVTSGKPVEIQKPEQDEPTYEEFCTEYKSYAKEDTISKAKWITDHAKDLCDGKLFSCLLDVHGISQTEFTNMKNAYWGTSTPKTAVFEWIDIKDKMVGKTCYDDYIGFTISNDEVTDVVIVNGYKNTETCYSFPLFNAIAFKYGLADTDKFEFVLTKDQNGDVRVAFQVLKTGTPMDHFDLSIDPMFRNPYIVEIMKRSIPAPLSNQSKSN